jgi:L-seryl-tRNA(Ser) seleniumtransferase
MCFRGGGVPGSDWFATFGVRPVINAVGYATRVSGSCPHPDVVAAMAAASGAYFEIDDLLAAASREIARATGAEAGIVTCGAGAALTLGAAACLAGNRPEVMDQLPDVTGLERDEIVFPMPGPFDYDHAIRLSGARLRLVDYHAADALERIEAAIGPRTAAVGYVWLEVEERPRIAALAELAHQHGLPLIVDGACALPPRENLLGLTAAGADLIAYSGGKHLGGPQASGILCGREQLIRSAWVQMVDMDVRGGTWSLRHWVEQGWIARAPRHGIGRSMKLRRYGSRDAGEEDAGGAATVDEMYEGLRDVDGLVITRQAAGGNGQRYPNLRVESGLVRVGDLQRALRERPRRILLAEDERTPDRAVIFPQCLQAGDGAEIVEAVREIVRELGGS